MNVKQPTILLVDDESGIRLMLRTTLESEGYIVHEAANGKEALKSLEHETPDLMVLDLNMPITDGMSVLESLKSHGLSGKPRTIILTAFGWLEHKMIANTLAQKPGQPERPRGQA